MRRGLSSRPAGQKKPHKANGTDRKTIAEKRQDEAAAYELSEEGIELNQGRVGADKGL